jgi:hypothetical protein
LQARLDEWCKTAMTSRLLSISGIRQSFILSPQFQEQTL